MAHRGQSRAADKNEYIMPTKKIHGNFGGERCIYRLCMKQRWSGGSTPFEVRSAIGLPAASEARSPILFLNLIQLFLPLLPAYLHNLAMHFKHPDRTLGFLLNSQ